MRLGLRKETVEGKGSFAVEIPGSEEEGEEIGDGGAFEAEASVFPVTVGVFEVGVFVGKVDTAGVADPAVNDGDFAVVAIVMKTVDAGIELVGGHAMNADGFEIAVVVGGKRENATEVVVHDVDIDALLDFCLKNRKDFIPDAAGTDDKVFQENVIFGGF